jgi:hypothetical protein
MTAKTHTPMMGSIDETIRTVTRRVQSEYAEMPGLCITLPQAQRLLAVDYETCAMVFNALTRDGVLKRTKGGQYVRGSSLGKSHASE